MFLFIGNKEGEKKTVSPRDERQIYSYHLITSFTAAESLTGGIMLCGMLIEVDSQV